MSAVWEVRHHRRRDTIRRYYDRRVRDPDDKPSEMRQPPPQEVTYDEQRQHEAMKEAFYQLAGDDEVIDAYELKSILNAAFKKDFPFSGFSNECCRSLVALMDVNQSGALDCSEFITLWDCLKKWKGAFQLADIDASGNMSSYELHSALHNLGFSLSKHIHKLILMRYRRKNSNIEFDDFVLCCCRLQTVFENIEAMKNREGKIEMDNDLFMKCCIYL